MLIINDKIQIKEGNEIYERDFFTRGAKRKCIQIEIPKQDGVTYDTLVNAFSDGASIVRRLTETRIVPHLVSEATETEDAVYEDIAEEKLLKKTSTNVYISKSKNGDQYLDSLGGDCEKGGYYVKGNFYAPYEQ